MTITQEYPSAGTSINQVPALVKHLVREGLIENGMVVLDYGAGKYDTAKEYVLGTLDVTYLQYDKYNRSNEVNLAALNQKADLVILANVLNVIKEPEVRHQVLLQVRYQMKKGARLYVSTYSADKNDLYQEESDLGQPTKKGESWQNCQKLSFYMDEVRRVLPDSKVEGGIIIAQK